MLHGRTGTNTHMHTWDCLFASLMSVPHVAHCSYAALQSGLIRLPLPAQQEAVNDFHMQHMINGDRRHCSRCPARAYTLRAVKLRNVVDPLEGSDFGRLLLFPPLV